MSRALTFQNSSERVSNAFSERLSNDFSDRVSNDFQNVCLQDVCQVNQSYETASNIKLLQGHVIFFNYEIWIRTYTDVLRLVRSDPEPKP